MTRTDVKITRYTDVDFVIDIIDVADTYEAWLSHKSYGISELMFDVPKNGNSYETTYDAFLNMVLDNLAEYEKQYAEKYYD